MLCRVKVSIDGGTQRVVVNQLVNQLVIADYWRGCGERSDFDTDRGPVPLGQRLVRLRDVFLRAAVHRAVRRVPGARGAASHAGNLQTRLQRHPPHEQQQQRGLNGNAVDGSMKPGSAVQVLVQA